MAMSWTGFVAGEDIGKGDPIEIDYMTNRVRKAGVREWEAGTDRATGVDLPCGFGGYCYNGWGSKWCPICTHRPSISLEVSRLKWAWGVEPSPWRKARIRRPTVSATYTLNLDGHLYEDVEIQIEGE